MTSENFNLTTLSTGVYMVSDGWIKTTCVWSIFIAITGFFGNGFVILALVQSSSLLKNATTVFIIALCVSGFLICSINIPLQAVLYYRRELAYSDNVCIASAFTYYCNTGANLMCLIAVTINRYVLIVHNKYYGKIYKKIFIAFMITFCWLYPLSMLLPTLLGKWGEFGFSPHLLLCTILKIEGKSALQWLSFVAFFLPFLTIVICYGHILCKVRKSGQTVKQSMLSHAKHNKRRLEEIKLTIMILAILCVHTVFYLPYAFINALTDETENPDINVAIEIAVWLTHCMNPFIYAVVNSRYRYAYKALIQRCKTLRSGNHNTQVGVVTVDGAGEATRQELDAPPGSPFHITSCSIRQSNRILVQSINVSKTVNESS